MSRSSSLSSLFAASSLGLSGSLACRIWILSGFCSWDCQLAYQPPSMNLVMLLSSPSQISSSFCQFWNSFSLTLTSGTWFRGWILIKGIVLCDVPCCTVRWNVVFRLQVPYCTVLCNVLVRLHVPYCTVTCSVLLCTVLGCNVLVYKKLSTVLLRLFRCDCKVCYLAAFCTVVYRVFFLYSSAPLRWHRLCCSIHADPSRGDRLA